MKNSENPSQSCNCQKLIKQTGKVMFEFDNDGPQEYATIYDYAKFTIELQQLDANSHLRVNSIEFVSKDGKRFKLFIESCHTL